MILASDKDLRNVDDVVVSFEVAPLAQPRDIQRLRVIFVVSIQPFGFGFTLLTAFRFGQQAGRFRGGNDSVSRQLMSVVSPPIALVRPKPLPVFLSVSRLLGHVPTLAYPTPQSTPHFASGFPPIRFLGG